MSATATPLSAIPAWKIRVLQYVSVREGRPDSLNRNRDGNGLSFGLIQWTQRSGSLGKLLAALHTTDPAHFEHIFGPGSPELLAAMARRSLAPVGGAVLWEEPWASRFVAAGRDETFVAVQWGFALTDEHFQGAEAAALILGVRTERAMALFYDRSVHQGAGAARRVAEELRTAIDGGTILYADLLANYARRCANRYRRTSPPDAAASRSSHAVWKAVGSEWHATLGAWDLYETVRTRTRRILSDPALSDTAVEG